jgi:hypothetical protein
MRGPLHAGFGYELSTWLALVAVIALAVIVMAAPSEGRPRRTVVRGFTEAP